MALRRRMDGTPALLVDSVPELATQDENDQEQLSESEQARRNELEYPEPEGDPTSTEEQTIAEITILANPIPTQSKVWHARLPNFLALETKPFEKATWVPPVEVEEEDSQGAEEGEKKAPVPDENVIRWRWGKDAQGKPVSPPPLPPPLLVLIWINRFRKRIPASWNGQTDPSRSKSVQNYSTSPPRSTPQPPSPLSPLISPKPNPHSPTHPIRPR